MTAPNETAALFARYVVPSSIEMAKERLDESAPGEILHMVAALLSLAEDTDNHADDLDAHGFAFLAEEARIRADNYKQSAQALCKIWGLKQQEEASHDT